MAGLLFGLGELGLKNLEKMDLFEEAEEKETVVKKETQKEPVAAEEDFLFDKTYECPVCYQKIKARTVKTGRVRLLRTELNLRPVYEQIEPLKYDVIVCPHCGYAALTRYFGHIAPSQIKAIKENIAKAYQGSDEWKATYTYEEALSRYRLCLANTIVKKGKASEKAYICLKAGWLLRSMQEEQKMIEEGKEKLKQCREQEREFLKNALEGFVSARQTEDFPICGMDQNTVEYLLAVLAMEFEQYEVASKLVSNILVSASANERMKDKAREVKEILIVKMKEKREK